MSAAREDQAGASLADEVKRLKSLVELGRLLADPEQGLDDKLQAALAVLARQARAEQASIMLLEGERLVVAAATNPRIIGQATPLSQNAISTRVVFDCQPVCLPDLSESPLAELARDGHRSSYRTKSLISLPLTADGVAVGVLNLADKIGGQAFTPADLDMARDLAGQVSRLVHFSALHSRLLEAHRELAREQREKDELLGLIIHDLKAPLTAARQALGLLRPDAVLDREERAQFLALADADLELLWRRVTNLLDLRRMERGVMPLQSAPLNLAAIAAEAVARLTPTARVREVELTVAAGAEAEAIPEVMADKDLLERILVNLVFNALKFSSPDEGGGGRVEVRLGLRGSQARLDVIDSGPGVDPALGQAVFQRHVQGAPAQGSSGLGLYFCRRAAGLLGGQVSFVNLEQGGARFTLLLPLARA